VPSSMAAPSEARELVRTYLAARYDGGERHQRRLDKILDLERRYGGRG
jgi:ribose 5-phosphate isomerase RpiB